MRTLLIFSGGMDSTTLLYDLLSQGHEVRALGFFYGQRHVIELNHARAIAEAAKIEFTTVDLGEIRPLIAGSSQTSSDIPVPEGHYEEESMKLTVVPNRNMIMLSIAVGNAISLKFDRVAYAAHGGDHAIYPDCRTVFVEALAKAVELCDWHKVQLYAPYLSITKAQIAQRGAELNVPYELTWSCYQGKELHCGKCGTCTERKEAFLLGGVPDPTVYG